MMLTTPIQAPPPASTHDPITVSSLSFGHSWNASISSLRNSRRDCFKPNEDRVIVDPIRRSIVLADGITRTKLDDGTYPVHSPSAEVAQLFCQTVSSFLRDTQTTSEDVLKAAMAEGNKVIARYNEEHFPEVDYAQRDMAGVAAIVGVFGDHRLWTASIADSVCLAANSLCVSQVAWEKTSASLAEYRRLGEVEARKTLRNRASSKFAYGALTGEEAALPFVTYQCTSIRYAQRVVFMSDGLLDLAKVNLHAFSRSTAKDIMLEACALEAKTNATDDKTIAIFDRTTQR